MSQFSKKNSGFSIIELLVSLGIVSVILATIVSNQNTYTDGAALTNLADDISLTISKAQSYGIAVKELTPGSADFTASYGLTMSLLYPLGSYGSDYGSDKDYLFFADLDPAGAPLPDKVYNGDWTCPTGGTSECLEKISISRGNYIDSFCMVMISGADDCNNVLRVDITFKRPNVEPQLVFFNNSGGILPSNGAKGARIVLKSPRGFIKNLTIYTTGQISVQ